MTKIVNQAALLQNIIDTCDSVVFTTAAQTVKATANAQTTRVIQAVVAGDFDAIALGDVSGKKLIFKAKSGMTIVAPGGGGSIQHANFFAGSVHRVTAQLASAKLVNNGDAWNVNAFDVLEIADPA
jgi:PHP family Zn ribbon phosphoesterase